MITEVRKQYSMMPDKNPAIAEWRSQGKNVLGYLCSYVPEEIIYAAGVLPVRLIGSPEEITLATGRIPSFMCYPIRSCIDQALKGDLKVLDGVVMTHSCDALSNINPLITKMVKFPYTYYLVRPHDATKEGALKFFTREVEIFKQSLEEFLREEITEESMKEAVRVYNENRALLRRIYDLRGKDSQPVFSGVEAAEVTLSSMSMPKEDNNRLLSQIIEEAANRKDLRPVKGPRVHISGSILFGVELFELIESLSGMVVSDDLCVGSRYFWDTVDTSLEPLAALSKYYLAKAPPCPCMYGLGYARKQRLDFIKEMVKRYKVDGVIFCIQRYCDPHQLDYRLLSQGLQAEGIPVMLHDVDNTIRAAQLRTKLETFFEVIGGRK